MITHEACRLFLDLIVDNYEDPEGWYLRLFQNDHTPAETDTPASYTEADFKGYAEQKIDQFLWTDAGYDTTNYSVNSLYQFGYDSLGPGMSSNTIYGWYIVAKDSLGVDLLVVAALRFASSKVIDDDLDHVNVVPRLELGACG